ncbi:hypothetical protein PFLUV_G00160310 [Perca fluviatilis]|uniref:Uncharacterized protein n=1 Tax=Perca fluviatilis TaxID=8168 RepID=A0A6A5F1V2_PERFL|nr:hypothetical protein PFLUV_G00160310 [Perca fluviatilis]
MSSGFCVRVLVLLLLTFGQHAKALSYFDFQRSLEPASSENLEPVAAASAGGPRGSSGGSSPESRCLCTADILTLWYPNCSQLFLEAV